MNEHYIEDGICRIILAREYVALIDEADWPLVEPYRWCASVSHRTIYVRANAKEPRRTLRLHRLIVGANARLQVDHINHDGLDNRRANLRLCTPRQNSANRRQNQNVSSNFKGVYWHQPSSRWSAQVGGGTNRVYLGLFDDPRVAAQAYNCAALALYGDFALLNDGIPCEPMRRSELRRDNTSGYKGVSWYRRKAKWCAQIRVDKRDRNLGYFDDPWEAAQAYNVAARAAWGESAYQNERLPDNAAVAA